MLNHIISYFRASPFKSSQVALLFGFTLLMNHKYRKACRLNHELSDIQYPSKLYLLHILFNRTLSLTFSKIIDLPIAQALRVELCAVVATLVLVSVYCFVAWVRNPLCLYYSFRLPVFKTLVYTLGVDVAELQYPLDAYESLGMFFTRCLPKHSRIVEDYSLNTLISPVDGKVMALGAIGSNRIPQISVKGATYNINCFLGEKVINDSKPVNEPPIYKGNGLDKQLYYIVFKIPLGSYHHFHSPSDFNITERKHFPGESLPINKFISKYFSDTFTSNERVVFKGTRNCGNKLYIVPVGTFGFGKIIHEADSEFVTNRSGQIQVYLGGPIDTKRYKTPLPYSKGDEIGLFKQGSAVVLVFESLGPVDWDVRRGDTVRVGQRIVKMHNFINDFASDIADCATDPSYPSDASNT